jgi:AcrR family transcriptional regulator
MAGGPKRSVGEAKRMGGGPKRSVGEAKRMAGGPKRSVGEAKRMAGEAKRMGGEAKRMAGEAKRMGGGPKRTVGETKQTVGEAKQTVGETKRTVAEARRIVAEARRTETELRAGTGAKSRGRGRPVEGDKRREILDAGLRVFAERGYHGTSVPEVAQAAKVSVGSLYRYFANKDALVNEVYRDAKERLRAALFTPALPVLDPYRAEAAQRWFEELWRRLGVFAAGEPDAFRFLEMQDHVPYLDAQSRQVELAVLAPLWLAGKRLHDRASGAAAAPVDVLIALLWGAFVGLVKAGRLGYLRVDDKAFTQAGAACWQMIGPEASRAASNPRPVRVARASKGPP